ncbi:MAG: ROK family protein [Acidobacteria bacterium]|nr:ROK family protein [Acidobacteriota bacterium]MBM3815305.1 ROK family protein [Acidimicrobiia bacterium]
MSADKKSLFAGVDLGGTNFTVGFGDASGQLVAEEKQPTASHEGPAAVLERIAATIDRLAARTGQRPAAVGLGAPGLVDVPTGVTRFLPNLPTQWRDVPVGSNLSARLKCPVYLLNDARAATLGEFMFGHGRGVQSMILFTLGTGVGGGVVIDGKLRLGLLSAAGEMGHICAQPDGPWCSCGSQGCLETLVSGPALTAEGVRLLLSGNAPHLHELCGGDVARVSCELMGAAARAGDAGVQAALDRAGSYLGQVAAGVVLTLHPELIVLGGGVAALDDLLIVPLRRNLLQRVKMFPPDDIPILRSQLGTRAGLLGGLAIAVQGGVRRA